MRRVPNITRPSIIIELNRGRYAFEKCLSCLAPMSTQIFMCTGCWNKATQATRLDLIALLHSCREDGAIEVIGLSPSEQQFKRVPSQRDRLGGNRNGQ